MPMSLATRLLAALSVTAGASAAFLTAVAFALLRVHDVTGHTNLRISISCRSRIDLSARYKHTAIE